ncbi:hypothetical protein ANN_16764 [Periplaneta americana]|uniref:Uncharacterized protein n=1 Tax=Periplaneta americana TaxID=6978 RepID=A0ABQ8SR06_PERAM|nr:hypothetical protein ANN_16764 [Periplaneta americana]
MAGLCEGGNEPSDSLKATLDMPEALVLIEISGLRRAFCRLKVPEVSDMNGVLLDNANTTYSTVSLKSGIFARHSSEHACVEEQEAMQLALSEANVPEDELERDISVHGRQLGFYNVISHASSPSAFDTVLSRR